MCVCIMADQPTHVLGAPWSPPEAPGATCGLLCCAMALCCTAGGGVDGTPEVVPRIVASATQVRHRHGIMLATELAVPVCGVCSV